MPWISIINIKSTKNSRSSSKVVGLGLADLWEFPTLLCRTDNIYCCFRVKFIYWGQAKSKIWFKMLIYLLRSSKWFSMLRVNMVAISMICHINKLSMNKLASILHTTHSNAFFFNENICISIQISLNYVCHGATDKRSTMPLSEPMMTISLNHICITRPWWILTFWCWIYSRKYNI